MAAPLAHDLTAVSLGSHVRSNSAPATAPLLRFMARPVHVISLPANVWTPGTPLAEVGLVPWNGVERAVIYTPGPATGGARCTVNEMALSFVLILSRHLYRMAQLFE